MYMFEDHFLSLVINKQPILQLPTHDILKNTNCLKKSRSLYTAYLCYTVFNDFTHGDIWWSDKKI